MPAAGSRKCVLKVLRYQTLQTHAESREGLIAGPPYYILEPSQKYPDGQLREDGESL